MKVSVGARKDSARRKRETAAARRALRRVLDPALGEEAAQPVVFYLSELFASAGTLRTAIATLGKLNPSKRGAIRRTLLSVETQVVEVIARHTQEIKKPLRTAVKRLYSE